MNMKIGPVGVGRMGAATARRLLGRPEAVDAGQLGIVAGGSAAAVAACRPALTVIGRRIFEAEEDAERAAADSACVPLPSANIVRDRLLTALARGEGHRDWSVIAREQARASGLD